MQAIESFLQDIIHLQAVGSVLLLTGFLVASTVFQRRCIDRGQEVLDKLSEPVKRTALHAAAKRYLERRLLADNVFTDKTYVIPIWFLIIVVTFCSIVSYFGAQYFGASTVPSYVLGGAKAFADQVTPEELRHYQSGTVFIGSMAFLAAYVWTISRLITRINTDDMSPITFYFLSCRILTACLVAGIARHVVVAIPGLDKIFGDDDSGQVALAALGFAIGWNPSLWIDQLLGWISDWFKRNVPTQRMPSNMPNNLTLRMVQGMVDNEVDRMSEIGVDNAHRLANCNPIVMWLKTSCTLTQIADWVAQAQLVSRFDDDKQVAALRSLGIRDIFGFLTAAEDSAALQKVAEAIKVPIEILDTHTRCIRSDSAFEQLNELRDALNSETFLKPHEPPVLKAAA
jgi:hypothetical protein